MWSWSVSKLRDVMARWYDLRCYNRPIVSNDPRVLCTAMFGYGHVESLGNWRWGWSGLTHRCGDCQPLAMRMPDLPVGLQAIC